MKIAVYGLWHLGSVTAACLASGGHDVVGVDDDASTIAGLGNGKPPVSEKNLDALIAQHLGKNLRFTADQTALGDAEIIWVSHDTPVNEDDVADVEFVYEKIRRAVQNARNGGIIVVSSQLPVGSIGAIEQEFLKSSGGKTLHFACVPENLRLGNAIEIFTKSDRYVIGTNSAQARTALDVVLGAFTKNIIHVSLESAEMSKHALNCFLALSVVYGNEIARLCEKVGADAKEVERCLKADQRIGAGAYLSPGPAFSGGTLARDASFLGEIAGKKSLNLPVIGSILKSNERHKFWAVDLLKDVYGKIDGLTVAVLGLTYKPGTDTLRRSLSLEVCARFHQEGVQIHAYDPIIETLPPEAGYMTLHRSAASAMKGAGAVVIITPWPEFKELTPASFTGILARPLVLDPGSILREKMQHAQGIEYYSFGRAAGAANK